MSTCAAVGARSLSPDERTLRICQLIANAFYVDAKYSSRALLGHCGVGSARSNVSNHLDHVNVGSQYIQQSVEA